MVRTQIQLDETTYALATQKAFAENKPLAAVVRDALTEYLTSSGAQSSDVDRFAFIVSHPAEQDLATYLFFRWRAT